MRFHPSIHLGWSFSNTQQCKICIVLHKMQLAYKGWERKEFQGYLERLVTESCQPRACIWRGLCWFELLAWQRYGSRSCGNTPSTPHCHDMVAMLLWTHVLHSMNAHTHTWVMMYRDGYYHGTSRQAKSNSQSNSSTATMSLTTHKWQGIMLQFHFNLLITDITAVHIASNYYHCEHLITARFNCPEALCSDQHVRRVRTGELASAKIGIIHNLYQSEYW